MFSFSFFFGRLGEKELRIGIRNVEIEWGMVGPSGGVRRLNAER